MARLAGYISSQNDQWNIWSRSMLEAVGCSSADEAGPGLTIAISENDTGGFAKEGPYVLMLDGQVYNIEDLGGNQNTGQSQAQIILQESLRAGFSKTLARLNGEFSAILLNKDTFDISIARDRFGIKPLYYACDESKGFFAFASRPKSLLRLQEVPPSFNKRYVAAMAGANYRFFDVCAAQSPFEHISQALAGHITHFKNGKISQERFAQICDEDEFDRPVEDLVEEYRALFADAVKRRLALSNNRAFTLSGGLDSSSVVCMSHQITGETQSAISAIYSDETYDESDEIKDVIDSGAADWMPIKIDQPDLFNLIDEVVDFHDEPVVTVTWLTHFLLLGELKKHGFQTLFGGLGGDEQHAGEYDYFFYFFADLKRRGEEEILRGEVADWIKHHDHPIFKKSPELAMKMIERLTDQSVPGKCLPNMELVSRYKDLVDPAYFNMEDLHFEYDVACTSYMRSHSRNEILYNTVPSCLRAIDRNSTKHGIVEILPYFDYRLVDFMMRIPDKYKIRNGVTKWFTRQVGKTFLPEATRNRIVKTGWNAPAHKWFAQEGEANFRDMIASSQFRQRGIFNLAKVEALIDDHVKIIEEQQLRDNHMMPLWQITNLELWMRNIERSASDWS